MDHTLLITDDSMIIRELIKDAATESGWHVVAEAANGQDAIDSYREHRPTAVTLDLVMPQFDGLHALKGIRELDPNARVLVVSAIDQANVLKEAIECGAADFIVKPFKRDRFTAALRLLAPQSASNE